MTDRTVVYRIQADVKQAQAQMAALGASVKKSADDMTAGTKEGAKFRSGLNDLGNTAGKIGLVAAVGLGAAVKKAADFDQAMSSVQAATHESAAAMDSLRQAALDAGQETAFSATEAAAGIENLAKAGVSTAEILDGGLNGALALAAAGEMEVADAAEAAAGAMAQFGLAGDQVPHIADLLAAAAGKAQGDVSDFTMALKQGGTVAAQTGLSLEETTGALAAMAEQSLLGSDAGTSFKTMLSSLTPNSDKAAAAMERYNINAFDAQGNFVGMTELAGQLQAGLGDLTNEQRAMALETIFGSDAVRAASIIYDNGAEGIAKWTSEVNDAGFAAETAAIKQDNLRGDLEKLGGALETALIGTGDGSQGPIRSLTQSLEDAVNAYNDLGQGAKSGVGIALAATATIGGGLFVFSKVIQSIAATREAFSDLGVTATGTQSALAKLGTGLAIVGIATAAQQLAGDLGDVDLSLDQMSRQLELIAAQGDAAGVLEDLSFSADTLGEALRDAAFNDFNAFGLGASDEIKELDAALAGLDADVAAEVFKTILKDGQAAGVSVKELKELFPQYAAELKLVAAEEVAGADAASEYAAATVDLSEATGRAEEAAERFTATLEGLNAVLDGRATFRDYEAAIDDFTKGLKENGRTFDINTDKGRKNQAALDGIARSALDVAETLSNADRRKFLTTAIDDLRTMGKSMGLPKSEINALIALLKQANQTDVKPKITADTADAQSKVASLKNSIEALRDRNLTITTVYKVVGNATDALPARANGGPIYGPGTKTSDSIPAMLSTGEYVIRAAAVDKYGLGFFDQANSMRLAEGGSPDRKRRKLEQTGESVSLPSFLNGLMSVTEDQMRAADAQLGAAEIAALAAEDQNTAAQKSLDAAQGLFDGVQSNTRGLFNIDPLAKPDNAWASSGDPFASLQSTIDRASAFSMGSQALSGRGLDGAALAYGLESEDNMSALSAMSDADLQRFEDMFNQASAGVESAALTAANVTYGQEVAQATAIAAASEAHLEQMMGGVWAIEQRMGELTQRLDAYRQQSIAHREKVAEATGAAVGAAVNGAAAGGQRDRQRGNRNRNRNP